MQAVVHFDVIAQLRDSAEALDWRFANGLNLQAPKDQAAILPVFGKRAGLG